MIIHKTRKCTFDGLYNSCSICLLVFRNSKLRSLETNDETDDDPHDGFLNSSDDDEDVSYSDQEDEDETPDDK